MSIWLLVVTYTGNRGREREKEGEAGKMEGGGGKKGKEGKWKG